MDSLCHCWISRKKFLGLNYTATQRHEMLLTLGPWELHWTKLRTYRRWRQGYRRWRQGLYTINYWMRPLTSARKTYSSYAAKTTMSWIERKNGAPTEKSCWSKFSSLRRWWNRSHHMIANLHEGQQRNCTVPLWSNFGHQSFLLLRDCSPKAAFRLSITPMDVTVKHYFPPSQPLRLLSFLHSSVRTEESNLNGGEGGK